MIQKLHHTIADGEGAIRMSEQFIDLARDATEPITSGTPAEAEAGGSLLETTVDTLTHNLRRGIGIGRRLVEGAAGAVKDPSLIIRTGADIGAVASSAVRQLAVTDHAHSSLWTERSLKRTLETLTVPFDDARLAAKALGGSLNDLFVTAAAGGAAAYHRAKGADIDELRISMPISTRKDGSAGGNSFSPSRALLPVGIEDPAERFTAIHDRLSQTKGERALSLLDGLAGVVNLLPTSMLVRLARSQVETVDFATSNVRGAPFDLYIAGSHMEHNFPVGPTGGTAFNLTLMSYRGQLDMGLHIDKAAIADPALLRSCIEEGFAELIAAAS
jgi:WS/DGAT/MGAT family acyltransferase